MAIIPMSANDRTNDCSNPETLELLIYRGNNTFTLYEDDGDTLSYQNGEYLKTAFTVCENGNKVDFSVSKAEGDGKVAPESRTFIFKFKDIVSADAKVTVDGADYDAKAENVGNTIEITVTAKAVSDIKIALADCVYLENENERQELTRVISKFQMSTDKKMIYNKFIKNGKKMPRVAKEFAEPIKEIQELYR